MFVYVCNRSKRQIFGETGQGGNWSRTKKFLSSYGWPQIVPPCLAVGTDSRQLWGGFTRPFVSCHVSLSASCPGCAEMNKWLGPLEHETRGGTGFWYGSCHLPGKQNRFACFEWTWMWSSGGAMKGVGSWSSKSWLQRKVHQCSLL